MFVCQAKLESQLRAAAGAETAQLRAAVMAREKREQALHRELRHARARAQAAEEAAANTVRLNFCLDEKLRLVPCTYPKGATRLSHLAGSARVSPAHGASTLSCCERRAACMGETGSETGVIILFLGAITLLQLLGEASLLLYQPA